MTVANKQRNLLRTAVITAVLGSAGIVSAEFPQPLERIGRLHGFGWSDGYHTCECTGKRVFADLPPKSFSAKYGAGTGSTFYDRFDAANGRCCSTTSRCESQMMDGASITVIHGSEVTRGSHLMYDDPVVPDGQRADDEPVTGEPTPATDVMKPDVSKPHASNLEAPRLELQPLDTPKPSPPVSPPKSTVSPITAALSQPLTSIPAAKKYPIRPEPPVVAGPRTITTVVASKRPNMGFSLQPPAGDREPMPVPTGVSRPISVPSQTPAMIQPVPPSESPSSTSIGRVAATPSTTLPSVALPSSALPPSRVPTPGSQPSKPFSVGVPAYAASPLVASQSPQSTKPHPKPLGSESLQATATETDLSHPSASVVTRPARLGGGDPVRLNPFASRPSVELARRAAESSGAVIYQPGSTSLK